MISEGYDLKLPDTAYIFQESYIVCRFIMEITDHNPQNYKRKGAMIVFSHNGLRDWLKKVFQLAGPVQDFDEPVNDIIAGLPSHYERWVTELAEAHPELKGRSWLEWVPTAGAQYLNHLSLYVDQKLGGSFEPRFFAALNNLLAKRIIHLTPVTPIPSLNMPHS